MGDDHQSVTRLHEMSFKDLEKCSKPREKAILKGTDSLADFELIAILLNTGTKKQSVIQIAFELLQKFNGLSGLMSASIADLCNVKGVKEAKAVTLLATLEIAKRIGKDSTIKEVATSSEMIYNIFAPRMKYEQQELFIVVFLNTKYIILGYRVISKGGLDFSLLHPRDVFREAVKINASKIIFVHNHPSGDPRPSSTDISTTKEFMSLGEKMGIPLVDHIIIGNGHFYSFKSNEVV